MQQTKPLSELLKSKDDSEPKKQSREEWRQQRELEEARKLGNAPAAVDETGKDINPHIPQYISTVPWYVGSSGPTLKHQRPQPEKQASFSSIHEVYSRGTSIKTATKYREGACENCGAMGHSKKGCFERPRKVGAKYSNREIAPDDLEQPNLNLNFDGKRDRWNGYDPSQYNEVVDEYRRVEEAKRILKEQKLKEENDVTAGISRPAANNDDSDDEDKYADKIDMPGTKVDSKQRITVRNLRIREDTAKYLRNLDPDSAHYDPKTRSMRDNPYKNTGKTPDEVSFAGENFVRFSGDTEKMLQAQAFAWEAHSSGVDIHVLAEPTKASMLTKEFKEKKDQVQQAIKSSILEKYGGEEHLEAPPKELLFAQSENYVEYSRTGQIIKGAEKKIIRSKYDEDVFINNHSTVWGSYWENFKWGYKCCHSFVRNSYCTGTNGILVRENATNIVVSRRQDSDESQSSQADLSSKYDQIDGKTTLQSDLTAATAAVKGPAAATDTNADPAGSSRSTAKDDDDSSSSESDSEDERQRRKREKERRAKRKEKKSKNKKHKRDKKLKEKLLAKSMRQFDEDQKQETDERKRSYNSMYDNKAPTEEDMEAYYRKRSRPEDPMATFLSSSSKDH